MSRRKFTSDENTYRGNLVVAQYEAWTLRDVEVFGDILVGADASLRLVGCVVHGHVQAVPSAQVWIETSRIEGPVIVRPDAAPVPSARIGGVGVVHSAILGDVRSVGHSQPWMPSARVVLGTGTTVRGNVITAWTDLLHGGASVTGTVWDTETQAAVVAPHTSAQMSVTQPVPVQPTVSQPSAASAA